MTLPALDVSKATSAEAILIKDNTTLRLKNPNDLVRGSGEGATRAMWEYLSEPPSGDSGNLDVEALWLLTLPVTLPVSAAVGAGLSHSGEEIDSALADYDELRKDRVVRGSFGERFLKEMKAKTPERWTCIELVSESEPTPCATHKSIAEIRLYPQFLLEVVGEYDPDIHFFGTVLVFVSANHLEPGSSVSAKWAYRDELGDFFDLTANDAALLRSELKTILDRFTISIVGDLFLDPHQVTVKRRKNFKRRVATVDIPQGAVVRVGWADVVSDCQKYGWPPPAQCL